MDGDGNPGVTLVLGNHNCDMYIVQRSVSTIAGVFETTSLLAGDIKNELTQAILGGTQALCTAENKTTPNPGRNKIFLMRVDGFNDSFSIDANDDGIVTCDEFDTASDTLVSHYGIVMEEPNSDNCKK
jgi:hypothetical protein